MNVTLIGLAIGFAAAGFIVGRIIRGRSIGLPTTADALADARRSFRWRHIVPNILWPLAVLVGINRLNDPDLVGSARIWWTLGPFALFPFAWWAWTAQKRLRSEFEQEIDRKAATFAFQFTVFWLFGLALLDAAYGLPTVIPVPFGLPGDPFGWKEAALAPLLVWAVAFAFFHRRAFSDK
jgi:hypothetical protein